MRLKIIQKNKMEEEKVYLKPGDCVTLRQHKVMQSPVMLVLRREQALFKDSQRLLGLRCRWFTDSGLLQEAVFSTKDLTKIEYE